MPKYIYQPLDKPISEFRLLRISKHPLIDLPQCSLQKYSLTDCPEYTALSYIWGEPTPTYRVAIEGANIEVRQNLFDFLDAYITEAWGMDNTTRPVFYWIDQICINQEDPIERSDQVRIMDKIYRQAKMVLVWLGCDPTMIEAVRRLREKHDEVRALDTLLEHPYFSRIWIVQEFSLSVNPPLFVCLGTELSCDRIRHTSEWTPIYIPSVAFSNIIYERGREIRTLNQCIHLHCDKHSSDPRDKVYGLLGLTSQRWRVRVDYTKDVLEVYFDAVAALFEELFDLSDPECMYPKELTDMANSRDYRRTLYVLARAMGVGGRRLEGLMEFLTHIQGAYLNTKTRNVQYIYTGRIYTRVQEQSSFEQTLAPEEEEFEVSWGSILATRQNPLLRDIIPEMGLQLVSATAESTAEQSGDCIPARDRWWCKHSGEVHYFDC